MITKTNTYRFAANGSTTISNLTKNIGFYQLTPNYYTKHKKVYYEVYIYHRDSSKDHGVEINLRDSNTNGYIFGIYQFQINHSSSISSSESGIALYVAGLDNFKYKYYGVPRHPVYGIGYDFDTGTLNVYNGTNSIIFSVSSGIPIFTIFNKEMYLQAGRSNDGGNSAVDVKCYFGDDGFNYGLPEGYHPACEIMSLAPTYEKENEMFIG